MSVHLNKPLKSPNKWPFILDKYNRLWTESNVFGGYYSYYFSHCVRLWNHCTDNREVYNESGEPNIAKSLRILPGSSGLSSIFYSFKLNSTITEIEFTMTESDETFIVFMPIMEKNRERERERTRAIKRKRSAQPFVIFFLPGSHSD